MTTGLSNSTHNLNIVTVIDWYTKIRESTDNFCLYSEDAHWPFVMSKKRKTTASDSALYAALQTENSPLLERSSRAQHSCKICHHVDDRIN